MTPDRPQPRPLATALGWAVACLTAAVAARADQPSGADAEFFEKEIRPILASRCLACHGPEKQKGGLRLDSREAALRGGDTGPAVVPGDAGESLLVSAIHYGDLVQMPPKSRLPPAEIASLTEWVERGVPWPAAPAGGAAEAPSSSALDLHGRARRHWGFQPIRPGDPPAVQDADWPRTPIDAFVLDRLERGGIRPAEDADRRTWLRRVTFDLIGLPPSRDEVRAFLADSSPGAEGRVVDRLLASPHYGERWARHWLDLVRYAETSGHEFDYDIPEAWRYRDYVIRALNADLPYDRFVIEQIAGDLLPEPRRHPTEGTDESVLGTGLFLLGEGTHSPVDLLEDEAARIDNNLDVLGKAFLGLTVACARCHDHKFDPVAQRDYYALAGYFRTARHQHAFLDEPGRIAGPVAALERLADRIGPLATRPRGFGAGRGGGEPPAGELFEDFDGGSFAGWTVSGQAFGLRPTRDGDLRISTLAGPPTLLRLRPGQAHSGRVSDRLHGVLRSRTFTIERPTIHYLAAGKGGRINLVIDGFEKIRDPIYGGLSIAVGAGDAPRWYVQDVAMWVGHRAYIEIADGATLNYGGSQAAYHPGDGWIAVDEIRFAEGSATAPPPAATGAVPLDPADEELAGLIAEYRRVEATIPPPAMGLALIDGTPEDARLLIRGSTKTPGDAVPRRFLEVFGGEPGATDRADLARRIVDPANPLAARVLVNRVWKHHFGEGLVRSVDDFGAMGQPPTHPELLDWLAHRFVRDGWSLKRLHRMLALSHAYRMRSRADSGAEAADPENRLLHRMPLRRLEAEALRDAILAVSGRLDRRAFGPSVAPHVSPFQDGRGRPQASGPADGAGRRSIYLNVRRNFLPPLLTAFDLPPPATCVGRRNVSNVPAQALALLNDPFVVEQAGRWAAREAASAPDPAALVEALYESAFARPPTAEERRAALAFLSANSASELAHVVLNTKEFLFIE